MFIVFTVLIVVTCIFTILIVLVQNSKGGGLASNFSSSNQYMGVRKTADFLEKATWTLGAALIVFSQEAEYDQCSTQGPGSCTDRIQPLGWDHCSQSRGG